MSIKKIIVDEKKWSFSEEKYITETKEYDRKSYTGDFDKLILENTENWDIKDYAIDHCDVVDQDDVEEKDLDDFQDYEIVSYLEDRGYQLIKCETIIDLQRFEKLKEVMSL
ncbi:hypothetical protein [Zunongwangia atlantica]|uniref:Uncharacterized protein n=1 Tax=Zunongwangia atlantica 22II14-10F7 TaxID=1185767 RepID=A0A1Y1SYG3_9FLAO|nr:hypothetical protein [Zunongwangia atlantica]ORL43797.1 hypothetical protein IIF7_19134 [Zunongwangia atlantica 22II14-10F7]